MSVLWTIGCHAFYPQLTNAALASIVTLRHILTHSGGFAAWYPLYQEIYRVGRLRGPQRLERRRQAARSVLQRPLAYAPGTQTIQ